MSSVSSASIRFATHPMLLFLSSVYWATHKIMTRFGIIWLEVISPSRFIKTLKSEIINYALTNVIECFMIIIARGKFPQPLY